MSFFYTKGMRALYLIAGVVAYSGLAALSVVILALIPSRHSAADPFCARFDVVGAVFD